MNITKQLKLFKTANKMKTKELTEQENEYRKNELMIDFLGYTRPHPIYTKTTYWHKPNKEPLTLFLFDKDWNWLMRVVSKIEDLDYTFNITSKEATILKNNGAIYSTLIYSKMEGRKKINAVYNTCIEFIKWYNKIK